MMLSWGSTLINGAIMLTKSKTLSKHINGNNTKNLEGDLYDKIL